MLYISTPIRSIMNGFEQVSEGVNNMAYLLRIALRKAVVFLACLVAISAVQAESTDFQDMLQSSLQAEKRGHWKQAIQLCLQMLRIKPEDIETMVSLSGLYGYAGNPAEQLVWSQRVLAFRPKNFMALINQGNGNSAIGDERRAMASFRAAGAADPNSPIPTYSMGVLAQNHARDKEAAEYFRKALRISPKFEDAQFNLAVSLANLGEIEEARRVLDRLILQNPSASDAIQLHKILPNSGKR